MTSEVTTAPPTDLPDPRRWWALTVLLTGSFLAPLDFFIVNVAMPAMTADLGASAADAQLVISAYAVAYAVLLITGGRLGDIYGRKSVFLVGLAGFALASAFCGLAWSPRILVLGRIFQAVAAAAMVPQALASIHALFPPHERGRALSIYGITIGLSSIAGQLLGGALVAADLHGLGWRLVFLINLPVAVLAFAAALPLLRDSRAPRRTRLDWGGVVLSAVALTALVLPLIEGRERGWPWWTIALLVAAPLVVERFRAYEIRLAKARGDPLVAIEIFQAPGLLRGLAAIMTLYALAAFFLTYSIYLQSALGFSALQAGLAILPFSAGFLPGSTFSPLFGRWLGTGSSSLGFTLSASGLVATALVVRLSVPGAVPPWLLLAPALFLIGLGMGISIPTMVRVIVERVEPQRAGLVGGIVNTTLQVSGALGVALLGGLFYTTLGTRSDPASIAYAFSVTLLGVAACHAVGGILAAGLGQRRRGAGPMVPNAASGNTPQTSSCSASD
jgi:EmrB/QacA subfamily drug resistance transporter